MVEDIDTISEAIATHIKNRTQLKIQKEINLLIYTK